MDLAGIRERIDEMDACVFGAMSRRQAHPRSLSFYEHNMNMLNALGYNTATFGAYASILDTLCRDGESNAYESILAADIRLQRLVDERVDFGVHVADAKKAAGLPIFDRQRELQVLGKAREHCSVLGISAEDSDRIVDCFGKIIEYTKAVELAISP